MKLFPYLISLLLSSAISVMLTFPVAILFTWLQAKIYKETAGFWTGFWLAGIESFILVWFSIWVFRWFGYSLPVFYVILITGILSFNNLRRYQTRTNKQKELGYFISQLVGIPFVYYQSVKEILDGVYIFW